MAETKTSLEPQKCPKCGSAPVVKNPKTKHWYVACSANSEVLGAHRVMGHTMFTKREAIAVWNEMK